MNHISDMNGHIKDPYMNNKYLKVLKDTLDTYDQPVKRNVKESHKRMVQAVDNFLPFINLNEIASEFDLTVDLNFMSAFTLPILWWASATLVIFGPYDALLSSTLSGFEDGLSDFATAQFEAMLYGIYLSFYVPWS